jgi:hypothetical protein
VPEETAPKLHWLLRIDRRVVYLVLVLALTTPLVAQKFTNKLTMKPAPLPSARMLFDRIEKIARERDEVIKAFRDKQRAAASAKLAETEDIKKIADEAKRQEALEAAVEKALDEEVAAARPWHKIVIVGSEVEPQTRGELYPQAEALYRHLMMRRIKFAVMTLTPAGAGYCQAIPDKVAREVGCEYGKDWANFGYQVGGSLRLQQMGKNIPETLKADVHGDSLTDPKALADKLPCMQGVKDASDVALVVEISGLVGTLGSWINYFASEKSRPDMANGCTAVSVTDSFAYLESRQIVGLLEGIAGAAAYDEFINEIRAPDQPYASDGPRKHMTSQTVGHVLIVIFVIMGNIGVFLTMLAKRRKGSGA